jgi:LuxR family maltose regulon positive regulatory protein
LHNILLVARLQSDPSTTLAAVLPDPSSVRRASHYGLLLGKLAPPDLRGPLVIRDRLFGSNGGLPGDRVTVIEAPGGYGKTTAMAQWCAYARSLGAATGWVSFDESDRSEVNFLAGVAAACDRARDRPLGTTWDGDEGSRQTLLERVENALVMVERPTVLFFDDLHMLRLSPAIAVIASLVRRTGAQVSFVVAGRPPVLTAFRNSALAACVDVRDREMLQFSPDEARVVIRDSVPESLICDLVAKLRGWPAMIRLISGAAASDSWANWESHFDTLGGNDAYDYLMEEVYRRLDPVQRLVLETASRLIRITGDVLDYVLCRTDCEAQLRSLQDACVLIDSTERAGGRIYRLHDLLRDFVSRRVAPARSGTAEQERSLARYYESQNDLHRALYHAFEAKDDRLVETLLQNMGWSAGLDIGPSMLWQMRAGSDSPRRACPQMERAIIYGLLQSSRVGEARRRFQQMRGDQTMVPAYAAVAEAAFDRSESAVLELLIEHYEDQPVRTHRIDELYTELSAWSGASQQALRLLNTNVRSWSHYDAGRYDQCLEFGKAAVRQCEEQGLAYAKNYSLFNCGLSSLALADFEAAARYWREAEDCVFSLHSRDLHRHQTMLRIFSALTHWEAGGEPLPEAELNGMEAALQDHFDGWPNVFVAFFAVASQMRAALNGVADGIAALGRGLALARDNGWNRVSLQLRVRAVLLYLEYGDTAAARTRLATLRTDLNILKASSPHDEFVPDCRAEEQFWIAEVWLAFAEGDLQRGNIEGQRVVGRLEARNSLLNLTLARSLLDLGRAAAGEGNVERVSADNGRSRSWVRLSRLAAAMGIAAHAERPGVITSAAQKPQLSRTPAGNLSKLTPRERMIVELIAAGFCLKEISRSLKLSTHTVASYRKACYEKLGVSKRSQVCLLLQVSCAPQRDGFPSSSGSHPLF